MSAPAAPGLPLRSPEGAVGAVLLVGTLLTQLRHTLADARLPRDMGLTWADLPALHGVLSGDGALSLLGTVLLEPGGWLELAVALLLRLTGPDPVVFRMVELGWFAALLAFAALLGARLAGARGLMGMVALVGALPAVVVQARLGWIHVPEAVLCLGALLAWEGDRSLRGPRTRVLLAVLGALALALRPSAVIWLAPLAVALVLSRPSRKALATVALGWCLGAVPLVLTLPRYLSSKLGARERYAVDVPGLLQQLPDLLGPFGLVVLALGLLALGRAVVEGRLSLRPGLRGGVLAAWVLLPVLAFVVFRAGLDNFTLGFVALAAVAVEGLASRRLAALTLLPWLAFTLPQWLEPPHPEGLLARVGHFAHLPLGPELRNHYRPYGFWSAADVLALVDATCEAGQPCRVGVDQGLFQPYGEEPGALELFLSGADAIELVDLREARDRGEADLDALMHYDCGELDGPWRRRFPNSATIFARVVDHNGLAVAWTRPMDFHCRGLWLTPGGTVARPEGLPPGHDGIDDLRILGTPGEGEDPATDDLERHRRRPGGQREAP